MASTKAISLGNLAEFKAKADSAYGSLAERNEWAKKQTFPSIELAAGTLTGEKGADYYLPDHSFPLGTSSIDQRRTLVDKADLSESEQNVTTYVNTKLSGLKLLSNLDDSYWKSGVDQSFRMGRATGGTLGTIDMRCGQYYYSTKEVTTNVTFVKPFKDTNYKVLACVQCTSQSRPYYFAPTVVSKSATGCTIFFSENGKAYTGNVVYFAVSLY